MIQPNNPFEMEHFKRGIIEKKRLEIVKEMQRNKKQNNTSLMESFDIKKRINSIGNETNYSVKAKNRMQHQLAFDSESFILNQLMLSIQFFENFEK